MSFKLAMNQNKSICYDSALPPGGGLTQANKSAKMVPRIVGRLGNISFDESHHKNSIAQIVSDQNYKSVYKKSELKNICSLTLSDCVRQIRLKKALSIRVRNPHREPLINLL
jgi:hypothetical protein